MSHYKQPRTLVNREPAYNNNFARIPIGLIRDPEVTHEAFRLYSILVSYAWNLDYCFPGQQKLAVDMGINPGNRKKVRVILNQLKDLGLISWKRNGQGATCTYFINRLPKKWRESLGQKGNTPEEASPSRRARLQGKRADKHRTSEVDSVNGAESATKASLMAPSARGNQENSNPIPSSRLSSDSEAESGESPSNLNDLLEQVTPKSTSKVAPKSGHFVTGERIFSIFNEAHYAVKGIETCRFKEETMQKKFAKISKWIDQVSKKGYEIDEYMWEKLALSYMTYEKFRPGTVKAFAHFAEPNILTVQLLEILKKY